MEKLNEGRREELCLRSSAAQPGSVFTLDDRKEGRW